MKDNKDGLTRRDFIGVGLGLAGGAAFGGKAGMELSLRGSGINEKMVKSGEVLTDAHLLKHLNVEVRPLKDISRFTLAVGEAEVDKMPLVAELADQRLKRVGFKVEIPPHILSGSNLRLVLHTGEIVFTSRDFGAIQMGELVNRKDPKSGNIALYVLRADKALELTPLNQKMPESAPNPGVMDILGSIEQIQNLVPNILVAKNFIPLDKVDLQLTVSNAILMPDDLGDMRPHHIDKRVYEAKLASTPPSS